MLFNRSALREIPQRLLDGTREIDEPTLLSQLSPGAEVSDQVYKPSALRSTFAPWPHKVEKVTFCRFSFSQTEIEDFEFNGCIFNQCLFIGTIFRNCRFRSCRFIDTNVWRSEFYDCFVDPAQFDECLPSRRYENIGVHLFQQLLKNNRQQSQPDFADEAQYRFRQWQRHQLRAEMLGSGKWGMFAWHLPSFLGLWVFDKAAGSGMRVRRLLLSCLIVLLAFSLFNWHFAAEMGLQQGTHVVSSFGDAFYVTTVIMTTLGFGDITPTALTGRLAVSFEALLGFALFAFLTSSLYRRLSS